VARRSSGDRAPAKPQDAWIFAYGSLMWDPGFAVEESRPGLLGGYHRAFCIYSMRYRGTPDRPGLVLGLDRGGSCRGLVLRVAGANLPAAMDYLWHREMITRVYRCLELPVRTPAGPVTARTFVVAREHPHYAGKLDERRIAAIIGAAEGERGACRAYLANTVRHMQAIGIRDRRMERLAKLVEEQPQA